ncbi:MAG: tetratricopeptide repeat protein [Candidatus Kariarchaeaceae archaeon]|jgi:tetratricopeptide (TPR) repeat protein
MTSTKLHPVIEIANQYYKSLKYNEAEQELNKLEKTKLSKMNTNYLLFLKSQIYKKTSRFDEGVELSQLLVPQLEEGDDNLMLEILISNSEVYYRTGKLDNCFEEISAAGKLLARIQSLSSDEQIEKKMTISNIKGAIYSNRGELDLAINAYDQTLKIAQQLKNSRGIAISLNNIGTIYQNKGKLDLALEYYEKSLKIKEDNALIQSSAITLANIGEVYQLKGEVEKAKEKFFKSLELYQEVGLITYTAGMLYMLIILTARFSIEEAEIYLNKLVDLEKGENNAVISQQVNLASASILKQSGRAVNRAKAQELFDQVSKDLIVNHELTVYAKLNLCELLLVEYKNSQNEEVIMEIEAMISELIEIGKKQNSFSLLAEAYFLQSKLALLEFDIRLSQKLLIQAEMLADENGLERLAIKISQQHDDLLEQLDNWDNMLRNNASLAERLEFTKLQDAITQLIKKEDEELRITEEIPVLLMILNDAGIIVYSKKFVEGAKLNDHLIGGFLTAINTFSSEAFSTTGSIERIKHNEFTLIMKPKDKLLFCYAFKENSYAASKRLENLITKLKENKILWSEMILTNITGEIDKGDQKIDTYVAPIFNST